MVERGRRVYSAFCSDYAHLGEVGHGQVGKTMNNLLLWINAALCIVTLGVMIWIAGSAEEPMPKARERLMNACVIGRNSERSLAVSTARDDRKSLHLDVFPQIGGHIEVFALDDCRLAFFKTTACDGLKLQNFLLCWRL